MSPKDKQIETSSKIARLDRGGDIPSMNKLKEAKRRFEDISRLVSDWIWETDEEFRISFVSLRVMDSLGLHPLEVKGKSLNDIGSFKTNSDDPMFLKWRSPFRDVKFVAKTREGFDRIFSLSGLPIYDPETGDFVGVRGTASDITEREHYQASLLKQANYDSLTGLPNRNQALSRFNLAIEQAKRDNDKVALLFVDLDHFKKVNDTLGHAAGDQLLKELAQRLSHCVRTTDVAARLSGDEFVIILPSLKDEDHAVFVAQKVIDHCASPYQIEGKELVVTVSIGIALYPNDGASPESLLRNGDAAMYRAKDSGKNNFCLFTPSMDTAAHERLEMENQLRHALEREELVLRFQPIVDTVSGQAKGLETLIRWNNDVLGSVSPVDFIPLAEDTGLIVPIGEWIIKQACVEGARIREETKEDLFLAINVSARQFTAGRLVEIVAEALRDSGLHGKHLELEVTEGLLLSNAPETMQILKELKYMGVRLSIDDFGTGFSSLSYLKKYPFDRLKIDRAFIKDIISDEEDAALTKAIIAMAHGLELEVIGEGVEDKDQLAYLQNLSCDCIQGFYFSEPLLPEDIPYRISQLKNQL